MPTQIDGSQISVVTGAIAVGLFIWRIIVWVLGLRTLLDAHAEKIKALEDKDEASEKTHAAVREQLASLEKNTAVVATKIDMLLERVK